MIFLPDTNVWIKFVNPGDAPVKDRFREMNSEEIRLCSVVKAELYYGAWKSLCRERNLDLLQRLFERFDSLPFDDSAAQVYGRIRSQLAFQGTPIGPNDLMIAAIALSRNLVLVTHNTREFQRVDGLKIEDWERIITD